MRSVGVRLCRKEFIHNGWNFSVEGCHVALDNKGVTLVGAEHPHVRGAGVLLGGHCGHVESWRVGTAREGSVWLVGVNYQWRYNIREDGAVQSINGKVA